ncbi:MAG: RdgB/HAM1 family non-canonical purine NTP pyrophosphatase [Prevotellaceae bacterium]|jgi:XTP/dITP diphosphohydrolase|nr:RdgB/HAM1 family non-canonical purine NTP pyrophosphatase [Prevotellaceae bacterium]
MKKLVFATNNQHKVDEIRYLLGSVCDICSLADLDFTGDIPENQTALEGNALEKARFVYKKFGLPCFADDTGLEIDALGGEPGVFSARYAGEEKNSLSNIEKVLTKMHDIDNRRARFRCVIALIIDCNEHIFEGAISGEILRLPVGDFGFGYDSVFKADGYDVSFAQMTLAEKSKISHRGKALEKLMDFLKKSFPLQKKQ